PYRSNPDKISINGPEILLKPAAAQTLALVLHELPTKAGKYGSLSPPSGKLAVSWQMDADSLAIDWVESNGPKINGQQPEGFGSKIIVAHAARPPRAEHRATW